MNNSKTVTTTTPSSGIDAQAAATAVFLGSVHTTTAGVFEHKQGSPITLSTQSYGNTMHSENQNTSVPTKPCIYLDGQFYTSETAISIISNLRREVATKGEQISWLEHKLNQTQRILAGRDRDVDQLRSVLDQKLPPPHIGAGKSQVTIIAEDAEDEIEGMPILSPKKELKLSTFTSRPAPGGSSLPRTKKQGVSGESFSHTQPQGLHHFEKDERSQQLIHDAILSNEFLKHMNPAQIKEIVDCMYGKHVSMGCYVIREGEPGDALYVTAEGVLEVSKEGRILGRMDVGRAFGELALLYNCNRTASVKALTHAKFWTLDRRVYQQIMMSSTMLQHEENVSFLQSVTVFAPLSQRKLNKVADVLEKLFYEPYQYIIREGEVGETFFIIKSGTVQVTQTVIVGEEAQVLRDLSVGDWFGERALNTLEKRSANVIALPPGVEVLCLDRSNFVHLIGDLSEIKTKEYGDRLQRTLSSPVTSVESGLNVFDGKGVTSHDGLHKPSYGIDAVLLFDGTDGRRGPLALSAATTNSTMSSRGMRLSKEDTVMSAKDPSKTKILKDDLLSVAILGIGGFGRVELVVWKLDQSKSFALKCMKKKHIVDTRQQQHIFSERNLMFEIGCPFVCKLYTTYRDNKFVYMLLEACLGGELWTILRNRGNFDDTITRFVVASVLEAFTYLHARGIVYRDLKPENLLLDSRGYLKLCDFGFAKKIGHGHKTWTFCGTPEYVAPEIILNKGHDHSADFWSLGILMFELLTGSPPFTGIDPMKIYNVILRGIDAIIFPPSLISRTAAMLIRRLCAQNPVERLGYGRGGIIDIKQNKYFQGFDWIGLHRGTLLPPITPKIEGPTDVSNFDKYPDQVEIPPDEISGWDTNF